MKKKEWHQCHRCKEDFEKLYLVPYCTEQFINVTICRNCSMDLHKKIHAFISEFLLSKQATP